MNEIKNGIEKENELNNVVGGNEPVDVSSKGILGCGPYGVSGVPSDGVSNPIPHRSEE